MMLKTFGWLLVLLLACIAGFIGTAAAMIAGAAWAFGLLIAVWGLFLLAEVLHRVPLRDVAWALGVGYGLGVIRWLDVPVEAGSGTQWLMLGVDLLVLVFFGLIAPAVLGLIAQRLAPRPELPAEKPASPEQLRRWGPKD
ncbi:hypothetical protein GFK26_25660 [Variovorax paradoxus]|uniref:Uncharacterized protein n=1 Tax=Variovorax paradoxus TaxID=34073 RepID=A0A5Q0M8T4_VARPD|nr:hypothetical protein [Variovorax paradoxus]QFZ85916.1 hypothetical protein GFK26_25660 [Variovorax paradoxus]